MYNTPLLLPLEWPPFDMPLQYAVSSLPIEQQKWWIVIKLFQSERSYLAGIVILTNNPCNWRHYQRFPDPLAELKGGPGKQERMRKEKLEVGEQKGGKKWEGRRRVREGRRKEGKGKRVREGFLPRLK